MFDLGWSEMLVIGVVALLIIGPKDLPKVIKQVSQWVRYLRGMAREFQSGVDEMVRDSDLDEARKALDFARDVNPRNQIKKLIDPDDDLERSLDMDSEFNEGYQDELAGEVFEATPIERLDADEPKKKAASKKAAAKKATAKKAAAPKAVTQKTATKKTTTQKQPASKASPKKTTAKPKAAAAKKSEPAAKPKRTTKKSEA